LLGDLLRDSWGFDGYVTSDCDADKDVWSSHNYTKTPEESVALILRAGTDVDCGVFMTQYAPSALSKGAITESDIDTVLKRLFRVRLRLGHFDTRGPLDSIGMKDVCNDAGRELARDGARQSIVLAKNLNSLLPLNPRKITSAIMIGPNTFLNNTVSGARHRALVVARMHARTHARNNDDATAVQPLSPAPFLLTPLPL